MVEKHNGMNAADRPGRPWYTLDAALFGGFALAYAVFLGVLHLVAYRSGFGRDPSPPFAVFVLVLVLLAVVLLPVLAVRMARGWREYVPDKPRLWGLRLAAVLGIALYLVVPFTQFGWPLYQTRIRGFRQYVRMNVDLDAMQAWLTTLDPNHYSRFIVDLDSGGTIEGWWPEAAPWANAITPLDPSYVRLALDDDRHLAIQVGEMRHGCGLTVGSKEMRTPPADFARCEGYRLPVAPGVYIWRPKRSLQWSYSGESTRAVQRGLDDSRTSRVRTDGRDGTMAGGR